LTNPFLPPLAQVRLANSGTWSGDVPHLSDFGVYQALVGPFCQPI